MEDTIRRRKSFWEVRKSNSKRFSHNELVNLQKLTLVFKGEDEYGYDDIEYYMELGIGYPTAYNMQQRDLGRWWKHTRNDDRTFLLELLDKSSIKEINKKIHEEGFKIKEIIKLRID